MKKVLSYLIICIFIPALILLGLAFGSKDYAFVSLGIAILSCVPFFMRFERKQSDSKLLIIIAVLIALSVTGRMVFAVIPAFKPITAMVIISAVYFGSEAGFMVGSMTAVLSNFYFGQGMWTPFQMFIWGFIGAVAGLISDKIKSNKILLSVYGVIAGIIYSLFMDVWTVLWADGGFNTSRYLTILTSSLPVMAVYSVSNVVFLLSLTKPMGRIFERLKVKYGI